MASVMGSGSGIGSGIDIGIGIGVSSSTRTRAVVLLLLLLTGADVASAARAIVTTVADGGQCVIGPNGARAVACQSGRFSCVLHTIGGDRGKLSIGVCNASYAQGNYCQYQSQPFAVGAKGIRGNSACETCDCTLHADLPGPNKATCDCKPSGTCFLDRQGRFARGSSCPALQPQCVVTKVGGGGKDVAGNRIDMGTCISPQTLAMACSSAGPNWANKFYSSGTTGVPFPGNPCQKCTCSATGQLVNCRIDPACLL